MANIQISEEEYKTVETLHAEALDKSADPSSRLASLYKQTSKIYAAFLNKEDGRRALRAKKQERQTAADQKAAERRASALKLAQDRIAEKQKGAV